MEGVWIFFSTMAVLLFLENHWDDILLMCGFDKEDNQ